MTLAIGDIMTLHIQFEDSELPDLKLLLNRALNTWSSPPKWATDLSDRVDGMIENVVRPIDSASIPQRFLEVK